MFKKEDRAANPDSTDTLIGEKSMVEGNIASKASLRIEGKLKGDIRCEGDVTIGKNGIAHSNIFARNVINAGTIDGSVTAEGILTITATGRMVGDINVRSLSVAEGGIFQGTSKMDARTEAKQKAADPENKEHPDQHRTLHKIEKWQKQEVSDSAEKPGKAASGH